MSEGARIGPNAVLQLAAALGPAHGPVVFERAGLAAYLAAPPAGMVNEAEVTALFQALRDTLPAEEATRIAREAGWRTGRYLLASRIPPIVQTPMRLLPRHIAARLLARAIARHAWTFCGSGRFSATHARPLHFRLAGCPLCRGERSATPVCTFYAATFETLFRSLVDPAALAREIACQAAGAPACVFEIAW